jgi:hypothetical protein
MAKPTLKRPDRPGKAKPSGQLRPAEERYRLRVDNQEKQSFPTKEAALAAGQVIKKAYPLVVVTVLDAETGATEIVD